MIRAGVGFILGPVRNRVIQRTLGDIRASIYDAIQRLSFTYHDKSNTGELISRSTTDVWRLQDKRCNGGTGTLRTDLFIHSEENLSNEQDCGYGTPYIERFCWDGDGDFYSVGCIKISRAYPPAPTDLARLHSNWDNWSGWHGSFTLQQRLYVY